MSEQVRAAGKRGRPSNPRQILDDDTLTDQQKRDYLEDWRLDLVEQQTATAENMPADGTVRANDVAERLRQVTNALESLKAGG